MNDLFQAPVEDTRPPRRPAARSRAAKGGVGRRYVRRSNRNAELLWINIFSVAAGFPLVAYLGIVALIFLLGGFAPTQADLIIIGIAAALLVVTYGLAKHWRWSIIPGYGLAALYLLAFPLGTFFATMFFLKMPAASRHFR